METSSKVNIRKMKPTSRNEQHQLRRQQQQQHTQQPKMEDDNSYNDGNDDDDGNGSLTIRTRTTSSPLKAKIAPVVVATPLPAAAVSVNVAMEHAATPRMTTSKRRMATVTVEELERKVRKTVLTTSNPFQLFYLGNLAALKVMMFYTCTSYVFIIACCIKKDVLCLFVVFADVLFWE
jgi:hypothetical protein